ncbi:MAG: holo-ACP synthase [Spirochaetales bacterium]|uniref:Holo-[acyl-carrier-protein] synthase n=1 Tax=Candidatus Thalassospirochaeta sargassi TaxID=3119039 RepID=A0AAJ1IGC5_9SPIO|nr:holo-ACP synthase [Spirochaetales bacterium]
MIVGIGVDIVHVDRMKRWLGVPGIVERYFHPDEIHDARARKSALHLSLAARFAAKEALGKAFGSGLKGIKLKDIQVVTNHNGKPDICVHSTALAALKASGAETIHLSLTHEHENAVAMVVLEK